MKKLNIFLVDAVVALSALFVMYIIYDTVDFNKTTVTKKEQIMDDFKKLYPESILEYGPHYYCDSLKVKKIVSINYDTYEIEDKLFLNNGHHVKCE